MTSRPTQYVASSAHLSTVPVLAVLVCHDGGPWLREALSALRRQSPRPRHVLAVDTGSTDRTAELLASAREPADGGEPLVHGVLTLDADTGFADAVSRAVEHAVDRWGDPGRWLWLLHDDCAPEPGCLATLLAAADAAPSAAVLGPLSLDWSDPRLVVGAGLSTDASGHRQTGVGAGELDWSHFGSHRPTAAESGGPDGGYLPSTEVLAMPSAGSLIRRARWDELGGYDAALPLLGEDIDFGWRANRAGALVLCVPDAGMRHARAASTGARDAPALAGTSVTVARRAHGLRTFLVNCSMVSFLVGMPRLASLCLLRGLGFALAHRNDEALAELSALTYLFSGRAGLRGARAARGARASAPSVRGLLTSRLTRLRNAVRAGITGLVRRRVAADAALGRLPEGARPGSGWEEPQAKSGGRRSGPVGPDALPAGALSSRRRAGGLRRPASAVAVEVPVTEERRPSPGPKAHQELVLVNLGKARVARELLLSPPLLLSVLLGAVSVVANRTRLTVDLAGGGLLAPRSLGATWAEYLATWHPVAGGSAAPAPAALGVLGILGAPFASPSVAVTVLLLGDAPIAGVLAYLATRRMPVRRWVRALVAAGYALLPMATSAVAQGRLDAVLAHLLLPPVLAGVFGVLLPSVRPTGHGSWLSSAVLTALGIAVIGAFSPLVHLTVLVLVLLGFVVVPTRRGEGRRRVGALCAIVLLPIALLLPWPAALMRHPELVLDGVGAGVGEQAATKSSLLMLTPGGAGAWPYLGMAVLVAVLVAVVLRPSRAMLAGLGVMVVGVAAVVLVRLVPVTPATGTSARHAWAGTPLVVVGAGLMLVLLTACAQHGAAARAQVRRPDGGSRRGTGRVALACVAVIGLLALAAGDLVVGGSGPLGDGSGVLLAGSQSAELARTGRSVFVVADGAHPSRQVAGRTARFGDDSIPRAPGVSQRLQRWSDGLTSGDPGRTKRTIAAAVASGVVFVVLPDEASARAVRGAAGRLVAPIPDAHRGTHALPALRLLPPGGAVTLFSPELSHRAVTGGTPPTGAADAGKNGVVPVRATPPEVGASVSEGSRGRLLVVSAEDEAGWRATVNGRQAPIVEAWGHLAAVSVPRQGGDIRVYQSTALRDVLLLAQAAALLFTLLTAIPTRRDLPAEEKPAVPRREIADTTARAAAASGDGHER